MDILFSIITIVGIVIAIIVHEVAHGYVADKLGDPTARLKGRLTLNPIPHIDPIGTIIVPLIFFFSTRYIFGWAKPVPIDPYNLRNPKKDLLLISLAGPASSLVFAIVLSIFLRILVTVYPGKVFLDLFTNLFGSIIGTNILLAVFNIIPIHPLDGGKILAGILPDKESRTFDAFMNRFGIVLLVFLIFPIFGNSLISPVITPVLNFFLRILIPGFSTI